MINQDALLAAFDEYARALLHAPYDVGEMLYHLTDQFVAVLDVDGAGVSLVDDDNDERLEFVTATNADIAVIEGLQAVRGEGPCHDAHEHGQVVAVTDLSDDDRWPAYRDIALERGCVAVAAMPMPVHARHIGAVNLYHRKPHEWSDRELMVGQVLANMASGYIVNNAELNESLTLAKQLQRALDSRVIIEQAKGMLAGRRDISPSEAFGMLRSHARDTNTRLHELAGRIVEGDLGPWSSDEDDT